MTYIQASIQSADYFGFRVMLVCYEYNNVSYHIYVFSGILGNKLNAIAGILCVAQLPSLMLGAMLVAIVSRNFNAISFT